MEVSVGWPLGHCIWGPYCCVVNKLAVMVMKKTFSRGPLIAIHQKNGAFETFWTISKQTLKHRRKYILPSEIAIPNLPNRWRQNMNSVWTDHYQRPLLTVCLYPRGAEGWEKLQQRPLITNLPLCVKFGTKLMGIRIRTILSCSLW